MDSIRHKGVIESIDGGKVCVRMVQVSACASCEARKICHSSDVREKRIELPLPAGQWAVGEEVELCGRVTMGMKAVWLSYVLPLLVLILALVAALWAFPAREGLAALLSLASLALYYGGLFLFRQRLSREFVFEMRRVE